MKYKAYFDGSAKPNPGMMKIGGLIKDDTDTIKHQYSEDTGRGTNNEAEYDSMIRLVEELINLGIDNVEIFGDSALVVNQVNGAWRARDSRMAARKNTVVELLSHIEKWKLIHVKRGFNAEADSLTR